MQKKTKLLWIHHSTQTESKGLKYFFHLPRKINKSYRDWLVILDDSVFEPERTTYAFPQAPRNSIDNTFMFR